MNYTLSSRIPCLIHKPRMRTVNRHLGALPFCYQFHFSNLISFAIFLTPYVQIRWIARHPHIESGHPLFTMTRQASYAGHRMGTLLHSFLRVSPTFQSVCLVCNSCGNTVCTQRSWHGASCGSSGTFHEEILTSHATPMWEALAIWNMFLVAVSHVIQFLKLLFNLCLGLAILMWIAIFNILTSLYNILASIFYPAGFTANHVLTLILKSFTAVATILARLGTLTFMVLHLALRTLYYIVVLWQLIYLLNLLYRFIQYRDFTIQGEFYFVPSPRVNHFGQGQQTLTIAPVVLNQRQQQVHPPNII